MTALIKQANEQTPPTSKNTIHKGFSTASYSRNEERANWISHGLGLLLSIFGLIALVISGQETLDNIQLTGVIIYGSSLILLFGSSTLYHAVHKAETKAKCKIADHCAIYLLIAGTYTPLMLIGLNSFKADLILGTIWALAIGGIIFKTRFTGKFKKASLALYLAMGWLCMLVIDDLIANFSNQALELLIAGGLFYSFGAIFYAIKRIPFNHAIWHLFVLAGATSHFACVYVTVTDKI